MITLRDVQQFCEQAKSAHSPDQLKELLHEISERMGFRYFALTHHIDLRSNPAGGVQIVNYPQGWVDRFYENRLFATDPIHRASHTSSVGFCWSNVDRMITLSAGDRAVLANARDAGIGNGFTIPANVPGETNGSCSFAMADGQELESEQLPLVQLVGAFAFESARGLLRPIVRPDDEAPRLTERQLECVVLVARGKTDWEISRILGVSHETVIQHIKDARDRYGVTKRTMLTIRALFDGSISFADILSR